MSYNISHYYYYVWLTKQVYNFVVTSNYCNYYNVLCISSGSMYQLQMYIWLDPTTSSLSAHRSIFYNRPFGLE